MPDITKVSAEQLEIPGCGSKPGLRIIKNNYFFTIFLTEKNG